MHWLHSRLSRKFTFGTAVGLLLSSLVFLILFLALYRAEIASERVVTAERVNQLLQASLENAMLRRDLEGLKRIVDGLGQQPGIEAVFITNPQGEIRFASDPALLGQAMVISTSTNPVTRFISDPQGKELLRSINPVANRLQCKGCHGERALQPVNGILYVDYDAAPIREKARRTTLLLMGAGATIVLLNLIGGWWFIQRQVISPVEHLSTASEAIAKGDLSKRAHLEGNDELTRLGQTFNRMAGQLQERISESENQRTLLQNLLDAIPDGVRVIGTDYRVLLTNRSYREQLKLGESDGVGDTCHGVSHQTDHPCPSTLITCPVHEIALHEKPVKALHRHFDSKGKISDVEIYAAPLTATFEGKKQTMVVESIRDLSRQIKYSHEQKLSELGKLATGVAHEIHNPLASVKLALGGLRRGVTDTDSEVTEYLELVDREVDKCVQVTERLLRLGMSPSEVPELVEITRVVEDTLSLVQWEAEQLAVSVRTKLEPGLRVMASDSEMRMVMLNLIQNAFHAMPSGGELEVSSHGRTNMVTIIVKDTGIGIDDDKLAFIFDPFYSRRADGAKGTGLGLSIVRTIVENYGGSIAVESQPGSGSRLSVSLPNANTADGFTA